MRRTTSTGRKPAGKRRAGVRPATRRGRAAAGKVKRTATVAPERGGPFPIVGIGASAGGLEAMTELLKHLPATSGMALVLVQHLDPTHESALASILARSTSMPVVEARNNMQLAPDRVYVIPPNRLMGISDRRLKLSPRRGASTLSAIDHFLRTLAAEEGSQAIGVILSGSGSDGTQGLLAIKAAGGVTFAQDEKSARYPAMPASAIAAGCVDFVLSPDRIARELTRVAGHPYLQPARAGVEERPKGAPAAERAFQDILAVLRQRTGIDFTQYKHPTLRRRIHRRMLLHKLESLRRYATYLRSSPAEVEELFGDILIHVTGFFRDPAAFNVLKKSVLPKLERRKPADEPLRIWVPGCSTGEEVYSIAIAVAEAQAGLRRRRPVQIFGTDINESALAKARAGVYSDHIKGELSAERLRRFFVRADSGYRVNKSVREMCIFARQNLFVDPPFPNLDLVSCRNVLIYLGPALQRKVLPMFHYALRPDGYLLLGAAETVGPHAELFALVDTKTKLYVRRSTRVRPAVAFGPLQPAMPPLGEPAHPLRPTDLPAISDAQQRADRIILNRFAPPGVIVNRDLDVLQFRGRTGAFLEHAHGEASLNLLKMVREGLVVSARSLVKRAIKQDAPVRQQHVRFKEDGRVVEISMEVIPFTVPPAAEKLYLVLFEPEAPEPRPHPTKASSSPKPDGKVRDGGELRLLREELADARESLQTIVEEQEATNEEARSANEEIMSANEELQSTNEELETAKEELQSTNEELTTLNEELENRNVELHQVNNDLHNLLASANIPIIVLGLDLRIRRFTSVAEQMFNLLPGDVGRPITDLNLPGEIPDLPNMVLDVIDRLTPKEVEVRSPAGRWLSVRIRPYKTTDNKIDGAVIAILDTDVVKNAFQQLAQSRAFAGGLDDAVTLPVAVLDTDLAVQFVNAAFCRTFDAAPEEVFGRRIYEACGGRWDDPRLHTLLEKLLRDNTVVTDLEVALAGRGDGPSKLKVSAVRLARKGEGAQLTLLWFADAAAAATRWKDAR